MGILAGAIAAVKYELIIDYFGHVAGAGASRLSIAIVCMAALVSIVALYLKTMNDLKIAAALIGMGGLARTAADAAPIVVGEQGEAVRGLFLDAVVTSGND